MIRNAIICAVASAAATLSSASFAAPKIGFSADHRLAFAAPHAGGTFSPAYIRKPKASVIYSNLALDYPKGLYWSDEGSTIYASGGDSQFVGAGFTPTTSATATSIAVAVGNFGDGLSSYTLALNADDNGVPGAVLWSGNITSTTGFGTCCGLETATIKGGVPLTAGTPYWVTVTLSKKQIAAMDDGAWNLATTDQVDTAPFAFNPNGTGWTSYPSTTPPAFAVYSK